jgi:hypothetical protein
VFIVEKKMGILRLARDFPLLINNIRCGYARCQGAAHTFSEHQKKSEKD